MTGNSPYIVKESDGYYTLHVPTYPSTEYLMSMEVISEYVDLLNSQVELTAKVKTLQQDVEDWRNMAAEAALRHIKALRTIGEVDALHTPHDEHGWKHQFCEECDTEWPCTTHRRLHPEVK